MKKLYFLFVLLMGLNSYGQDVLVNGNFETWTDVNTPDGWTLVDSVTQESTIIYEGSYSAKQEGGRSDLGQTISDIVPGDTYVLTIHYKVEVGTDGTDARIWSKWYSDGTALTDDADVLQGPDGGYLPNNNGEWSEYTTTVVAPANATDFYFEVRTYSGAIVYWDDFSFVHQAPSTPSLTITSPTPDQVFAPNVTTVPVEFVVQNFNVAQSGGDGYIVYTFDNDPPVDVYDATVPITLSNLTPGTSHQITLKLVDNNGDDLSPAVTASVTFSIASYTDVATLADLRAASLDNYYNFTGEAFATGAIVYGSGAVKAFAQDDTAGIMAYIPEDVTAEMANNNVTVNMYDGVTGVKGKLIEYNGVLELEVTEAFNTTGNNVDQVPQVVSIPDYIANHEDYESELIKIENVTVDNTNTTFALNVDYDVTDGTDTVVLRTIFSELEGQTIPTDAVNITAIAGEYKGTPQIYPRDINDFETVQAIGINNIEGLEVYPNPVLNKQVFITSESAAPKQVIIYDILGKAVISTTVDNQQPLNVGQLKAGIYMMKIIENDKLALEKLIIK